MKCNYCKREFNEIESFNKEFREHFESIGINNYEDSLSIPEDVEEIQCPCGCWNKFEV